MIGRRVARGARGAALAAALAAWGAAGASCALSRGEAMGTVAATLDAQLAKPADRDLGDGFERLASDYQVRVTRFELVVDSLLLEDLGGAATGATFDPSAPPEGYGLCHNGHCHADDGRLVPYEEIAAELSGGGEQASLAMAIEVGSVSLLDARPRELDCGDCSLEEGEVGRVRLVASRLVVELEVRDGRAAPRLGGTLRASAEIDLATPDEGAARAPGELTAIVDVPVNEDEPRVVALSIGLAPSVALLDEVDFASLPQDGGAITIADAAAAVRAAFLSLPLDVRVERRDD